MKNYEMPIVKVMEFSTQMDVLTASGDIEFPEVPLFSDDRNSFIY